MYEDAVQADLLQVQELLSCRGYENIRERLADLSFARLSTKKDPNVEEERDVYKRQGEEVLDLFMITKYYERIGDHATNIAEWVEYSITGERSNEN